MKRTKRRRFLRNVAVALGRIASGEDCPPEVVSGIDAALTSRLLVEEGEWVGEELSLALSS